MAADISLETAPPVVVRTAPPAGATNVDPALSELRVTFSKPMLDRSWSWSTWGEENFPEITGEIRYEADGRTCVLPVKLEAGKFYATWLNSQKFGNFKDREGRPAVPYLLTFTTSAQSSGNDGKADGGYEYVVQPGDTLSAIVQAYTTAGAPLTVNEILSANPGLNPAKLQAGQKIFLPVKPGAAPKSQGDVKAWVEEFFAHNFRDITSRDTLEWGDAESTANGNVSIRYRYRARIWDKETVTNDQVFTFDPQGGFVSVKDVYGSPEDRMKALVEKFFANNYRDISSRDTLEWGEVTAAEGSRSSIRYKYRALIRNKETVVKNEVFTFDAEDRLISVTDAPPEGASTPETTPLLNDDQRAVIAWTDRQFRSYFDDRTFDGWSDTDLKALEAKCIDALSGPRSRDYYTAINTLGALRSTNGLPRLRELAFERVDKNNRDRWMAVRVLGILGDRQSVPDLIHLVYHGNPNTHWWSQIALVQITGQNFGTDWEAWGKWWNASGGQPPCNPEIIRWWDGQAETVGELKQTMARNDEKFIAEIKPR